MNNYRREDAIARARLKLETVQNDVRVPEHATVQFCEGGAFVECVVWVPDDQPIRRTDAETPNT